MSINFREMLGGGDRRSVGRSLEATEVILAAPQLLPELLDLIETEDPILRSRAAHAVRHAARLRPELMTAHKDRWLIRVAAVNQWEVREQFCIVLPVLPLTEDDVRQVMPQLQSFLGDRSSIVRTCAMQAMVDLTQTVPSMMKTVRPIIEDLTINGSAAMRARGRKLLKQLEKHQ